MLIQNYKIKILTNNTTILTQINKLMGNEGLEPPSSRCKRVALPLKLIAKKKNRGNGT